MHTFVVLHLEQHHTPSGPTCASPTGLVQVLQVILRLSGSYVVQKVLLQFLQATHALQYSSSHSNLIHLK